MTLFGFLNCDKPSGMTSRDVVNVVQRRLRKIKVGHAGTLDPIAVGVLVLGVGPAVRLVPYVQQYQKHYRGTFRLGVCSDSGDTESELREPPDLHVPSLDELQAATGQLVGRIEQTPPAYSAIHIDGKRAYQRIRQGEVFEMPKRLVDIHSLTVLDYEYPKLELDVVCGSGTYIRTIGMDLANAVGSVAVMTSLRRSAIGPFVMKTSLSIEQLRKDDLQTLLSPPELAIEHLPRIVIDQEQSRRLGHGLEIDGDVIDATGIPVQAPCDDGFEAAALMPSQQLRAIVRRKRSAWYPYRVFPLTDSELG
jgi:tRNA pseudouridine55 synthase